jgi:hypothetical protein
MRLYISNARRAASAKGTPGRPHSLATNIDPYLGNEDSVGLVVLDHAETFAIKQNSGTIGSTEEAQGNIGIKAAGQVRCCASGKAAVIVCTETDVQGKPSTAVKSAMMERKHLQGFLDMASKEDEMKPTRSCTGQVDDAATVRQWFTEHKSTKPIAGAVTKRTRFTGLHNTSTVGIWATLDKEVCLKSSLYKDFGKDDWVSAGRSDATKFPHAILEVRREGSQAMSLIQTLDRSHLVRSLVLSAFQGLTFAGRTRAWLLSGSACCMDLL